MNGFRHTNIPVKALFFSLTGTSLKYFRVYFYIQFFSWVYRRTIYE